MTIEEKLQGIPSINYVNLIQSKERSRILEEDLRSVGVTNINQHLFDIYENCVLCIEGPLVHLSNHAHLGASTSHLLAIKKWLKESNEPYAIFCEDDLSIETVQYWNFTWNEFVNSLPEDWECVQLVQIQELEFRKIQLNVRGNVDWSACGYLIKREYAEKLIESRIKGNKFLFEMDQYIPSIEHVLYYGLGKVYTFQLFVENVRLESSLSHNKDFDVEKDKSNRSTHFRSHKDVMDWWKDEGQYKTLKELNFC